MSNKLSPFQWNDVTFNETILIDGVPHITVRGIGEWLKFVFPRQAISGTLDWLTCLNDYSAVTEVTLDNGRTRKINVYPPMVFLVLVSFILGQRVERVNISSIKDAMLSQVVSFSWHFHSNSVTLPKE